MITKRVLSLIIDDDKNGGQAGMKLADIEQAIKDNAWKAEYLPMLKAN